jgi:hypothetical protein
VRIRQVRQDFWTDEKLGRMPDPVRLFYIGLWCVADDKGWFRWDAARVAALLYPFRQGSARERSVTAWAAVLTESGRLVMHPCGCAEIPTLSRHQVIGGKKAEGEYQRHLRTCPDSPGSPGLPDFPVGRVSNGDVTERNGARAGEPDGPRVASDFQEKVPRLVALGDA